LPRVEEVFENVHQKILQLSLILTDVTEIKDTGKEKIIVILPEVVTEKTKSKSKKKSENEYSVSYNRIIFVKAGDHVKKGDIITDGSADIDELFKYGGRDRTQDYIISEVSKLYELQGESVSRKHIEVIVRQMFSRRLIKDGRRYRILNLEMLLNIITTSEKTKEFARKAKLEAKASSCHGYY
jgi:DNA-directed RNA polymerase subunit beta'